MISLASNVGSGLFITTGKSLADGGPGKIVYLVSSGLFWCLGQSSEPDGDDNCLATSGNYVDYTDRWADPALTFGAGFAEWLSEQLASSYSINSY